VRRTGFADGFGITAALLSVAEPGTDDPAHDGAVSSNPVGEDDGQRDRIGRPERHDAAFAVVPARVFKLDIRRGEDLAGELEVESALGQVPIALRGIPVRGCSLQDTLFIASALGRSAKSFIFMNACQVGVGGEELGQYAGFAGYAIAAGFSGFMGPLWSVNDEVAKRIAVDFYRRCFGTDGTASRPVGDVLADMRNQYLSEPDPQKRQSTWVAYVHYGHPHFTLTHAQ
jgi:hypothetical protein